MTTIIDIAKEAGVSFKTVSRVLNGEANVRPTTREKVLKAARGLNYSANTAARNLRSKRPKMVALLINNPSESYAQSLQLGALMGCQKHGLFLRLYDTADADTLYGLADGNQFIGFILAPPISDSKAALDTLEKIGLPFVCLGSEHADAAGIRIGVNDRGAAFEITNHLLSLGHKNIGFIKGHPDYDVSGHRFEGYKAALTQNGITLNSDLIKHGQFSYASGLEAAEELLSYPARPTAIFASNDEMAAGCLAAAYKKGLRVPDTLSIVGFDDSPIATAVYPQLTTIRQSLTDMVETAVELLVKHPEDTPITKLIMDHTLIERDSTGPVPQI